MKQNLLSIGSQDSQNSSHQIQYSHLYKKSWLFGTFAKTIQTDIASENFIEKNYTIKGYQIAQKSVISFQKHQLGCFYELQNKENQIGNFEFSTKSIRNLFSYAGENKSP
jgi:hypothetical protein